MIRNRHAIVALLTGLNFLNYLDRYLVAAMLPRISAELGLSNFEGGLLATVFLLGYFITAPVFGVLGDRMSRKLLIALGVLTWSLATIGSGLAGGLATLIVARAVVGVGEASYATLAPTIIDDITPHDKKGKALAIFYLAIPLGGALGYLLGGYLQQLWGWRAAFFAGGIPGIVLSVVCLAIHEPARHRTARAGAGAMRTLARIVQYRRGVLGYCAHTAAIGAFAYWGPTFLSDRFADALASDAMRAAQGQALELGTTFLSTGVIPAEVFAPGRHLAETLATGHEAILKSANFWFGLTTVVGGAIGTITGGRLADRALRKLEPVPADAPHDDPRNRRAINAQLRVCAIGVAIATPFAAAAFFAPAPPLFFALVLLAEIGLFMSTAPINAILLRSAPAALRASAMAIAIFAIHIFGDLWSPPLVGTLLDVLLPTAAMMALPIGFALATYLWWPRPREAAP
jgi:MFS transporter, Spinster family, sphingosine-1-phosphate transporter